MLSEMKRLLCAVAIASIGMPRPLSAQAAVGLTDGERLLDSLATAHGKHRYADRTALREFPGRSLAACVYIDADTLTYFYRDSTGILEATKQIIMDERSVRAAADSVRQMLIKRYGAGFSCLEMPTLLPNRTTIVWHEWYVPGASIEMHVISYRSGEIRPVLAIEAIAGQQYCLEWIPPPMYY